MCVAMMASFSMIPAADFARFQTRGSVASLTNTLSNQEAQPGWSTVRCWVLDRSTTHDSLTAATGPPGFQRAPPTV